MLDLRSNGFTGTIPESLARATSLESLFLSNNELVGSIPASLGDSLTKLEYLGLSKNHLSGPIPNSIGSLQVLYYSPSYSYFIFFIFYNYFPFHVLHLLSSFTFLLIWTAPLLSVYATWLFTIIWFLECSLQQCTTSPTWTLWSVSLYFPHVTPNMYAYMFNAKHTWAL